MGRFSHKAKFWVFLLAIWLMFEPLVVTVVRANEMPKPVIKTEKVEGIADIEEVMTPTEYLEYMLELR